MPTIQINVSGIDALRDVFIEAAKTESAKRVVAHHTLQLQKRAKELAVFRGHYGWVRGRGIVFIPPTGFLQRSLVTFSRDNGLTGGVTPLAHYGAYVELGTRFMAAQPYLFPALREIKPKFLDDIARIRNA